MSIMAKYAQIFWAEPGNQDVQDRNNAVETLRADISRRSTREAIALAATIAGGFGGAALPAELATQVEKAISDHSAAFVLKGKETQAQVCLAVAALVFVQNPAGNGNGWTAADALAASLWSALTLQDQHEHPKMEELRQDLIEACRNRVSHVAKLARRRADVPDVGTLTIPESDPGGTRANNAYRKATAPVIAALKSNQDLAHEEVDFLWWATADYSELLGCALDDVEPFSRAVANGLEGATMLCRLPSDGLRHAILRRVGASDELTLAALVDAVGERREKLRAPHIDGWAQRLPLVFPLISSLVADENRPETGVGLNARGWGSRALLEAAIVAMEERFSGVS